MFGVETSILARDLAWDWIGDAHERFSVGDEVLVRILNVRRNSLEDLGIRADIKSTSENTDRDNLQKCRIQGKYAGKVTDVHKGVVYVRLANGVNAVAHSCYDYRMPGKKDDVSFAVTHLDVERGIAQAVILLFQLLHSHAANPAPASAMFCNHFCKLAQDCPYIGTALPLSRKSISVILGTVKNL